MAKSLRLERSSDWPGVGGGERRRQVEARRSSDGRLVAETLRFVGADARQGEYWK